MTVTSAAETKIAISRRAWIVQYVQFFVPGSFIRQITVALTLPLDPFPFLSA